MDSQDSLRGGSGLTTGAENSAKGSKTSVGTKVAAKADKNDRVAVLNRRASQKSNQLDHQLDHQGVKKEATEKLTDGSVTKVGINRQTVFSLEEARDVVAVIYNITRTYSRRVDVLIDRLEAFAGSNEAATLVLEAQVDALIQEWQGKVRKLGALPQGLWIADIDSGDGYFCWKFPESTVQFWHGYTDGFSKRRPVDGSTAFVPLKKLVDPEFTPPSVAPMRMVSVACPPALQRMEIPE